jgi:hypothetical protein
VIIEALGKIGRRARSAIPALKAAAKSDPDDDVKEAAKAALKAISP